MSNVGLEKCLKEHDLKMVRTQVGDRYVVEEMRQTGCNLGGENSGHIILLDHSTTGDGIVAALYLLSISVRDQKSVSELASVFVRSPQKLKNIKIEKKIPLDDLPEFQASVREVERELGDSGRVLVRYSGTEMKARVMVEGDCEADITRHANHLAEVLQQSLEA